MRSEKKDEKNEPRISHKVMFIQKPCSSNCLLFDITAPLHIAATAWTAHMPDTHIHTINLKKKNPNSVTSFFRFFCLLLLQATFTTSKEILGDSRAQKQTYTHLDRVKTIFFSRLYSLWIYMSRIVFFHRRLRNFFATFYSFLPEQKFSFFSSVPGCCLCYMAQICKMPVANHVYIYT